MFPCQFALRPGLKCCDVALSQANFSKLALCPGKNREVVPFGEKMANLETEQLALRKTWPSPIRCSILLQNGVGGRMSGNMPLVMGRCFASWPTVEHDAFLET